MSWALFDSQAFVEQARGGVSRYFGELMAALAARGHWRPAAHAGFHHAPLPWSAGVRRVGLRLRIPAVPRTTRLLQGVNRSLVPRQLPSELAQGVYHPTWYDRRMIARFGDLPRVVTVHDLIPESWPEVTSAQQLADKRAAVAGSAAVICVSAATRDDLVEHYPEAADRAIVIHLGLPSYLEQPQLSVAPADLPQGPYVVYVGNRGSYKNFATLVQALGRCRRDVRLVAVGGGPLGPDATRELAGHGAAGRVHHLGAVDDARLTALLRGARALVSPSLKEGFGLPPLEALALGTPVLLSDIPVYREVYGDWARFFPPEDVETLADLLADAATGQLPPVPSREELRQRFSWARVAQQTEAVYEAAVTAS